MAARTRVLVVDDSALMRELMRALIATQPDLEIVGTAGDPYAAWDQLQRLRPDVMTLDVEMPKMDGLTFLEKLMRMRPMPVVMVSSLTERGCQTTLRALELGAVDFVAKPKVDVAAGIDRLGAEICEKIRVAARARVRAAAPRTPNASGSGARGAPAAPGRAESARPPIVPGSSTAAAVAGVLPAMTHSVLAIGASTGGTEALRELLAELPPDAPGTVIVQHMPERFTQAFADRLDGLCRIRVQEAADGDRVIPGRVLIAPGGRHLVLVRSGAAYEVRVTDTAPVNRHRPSVDVLFESVARAAGPHAIGAILTGMGNDGARGMLAMRQAGAWTIAQDEASCVVFGMPREAIALGGACETLPLSQVAGAMVNRLRSRVARPA